MHPSQSTRSEKLDIRISVDAKRLLQEAARERHTTVSQFVLETALHAASDILAERTRISLDAEKWQMFLEAIDAPPRFHLRMERLLNESSILD